MFLINLFRWFRGYIRVRFSGDLGERMINLCASHRISAWNIRRRGSDIEADVYYRDFKKIRNLRRPSRIPVCILMRSGFPFWFRKYKARIGFLAGMCVFFITIIALSNRIWSVEISGNKNLKDIEIVKVCEELGVSPGVSRNRIDTADLELKLPLRLKEISWAAFNIEGTRITVEVEEVVEEKYEILDEPCNLIAIDDGIVRSVEVISGFSRVKPGDSVASGVVLVEGFRELGDGTFSYFNSEGKVIAESNKHLSFTVPKEQDALITTGAFEKRFVFDFFRFRVPLYSGHCDFNAIKNYCFDCLEIDGVKLPIGVHLSEFLGVERARVRLTDQEAILNCRGKLNSVVSGLEPVEWEMINEEVKITDDVVTVVWEIRIIRNIAIPKKIEFSTSNS